MQSRIKGGLFQGVDFLAVLYYLLLVAAGCICITAASFDEETADFFAFSHFYIKQYMWVTAVLVVALVVLLLDVRYYHMWAYPLYIIGIVVMIGVLIAGKEVNGAKSWIELGSLRIQPVEFVKIATALALARVMSNYSFSINRFGDLLRVGVIVGIPMLLTILQNDTGSGIVLGAFLFVLYREGLNKWLCIPILLIAALFIVSFLLTPMTLLVLLILICVVSEAMMNGRWRSRIVYLASLALSAIVLSSFMGLIAPGTMDIYRSLLTVTLASLPIVAVYAYRTRLMNILLMAGRFDGLRPGDRLYLRIGAQTAPAGAHPELPGHRRQTAGDRLQRQPVENRHRLGRPLRQGVPARNADQIQLRARKTHRLHLLHRRRGVGVSGRRRGARRHVPAAVAADENGRTAGGAFRAGLLLQRGGDPALPRAGQRGHDDRADARHGYSAPLHELRGIVAAGLHHPALHRHPPRCFDAAVPVDLTIR
jgi:hypothetical protein